MPADTVTETVTLDREAVMELLVEAHGVSDALAKIAGGFPTPLTAALENKTERVAELILGEPDEFKAGPRVDLWDAGKARARELLTELAGKGGDDAR